MVLILKGVRKERLRKTEMSTQFFPPRGKERETDIFFILHYEILQSLSISLLLSRLWTLPLYSLLAFHSLFPYHALLLSRCWFSSFTPSHTSPLLSFPSDFSLLSTFIIIVLFTLFISPIPLSITPCNSPLVIFQPLTLLLFLLFLTFSHSFFSLSIFSSSSFLSQIFFFLFFSQIA